MSDLESEGPHQIENETSARTFTDETGVKWDVVYREGRDNDDVYYSAKASLGISHGVPALLFDTNKSDGEKHKFLPNINPKDKNILLRAAKEQSVVEATFANASKADDEGVRITPDYGEWNNLMTLVVVTKRRFGGGEKRTIIFDKIGKETAK